MSLPWMYQLGLMRLKDNFRRVAIPHGVRPFQACFFMVAGAVFDFVGGILWTHTLERDSVSGSQLCPRREFSAIAETCCRQPPPSGIDDWSHHHYFNVRVIAPNTVVKETELDWDEEFWAEPGSEARMLQLVHEKTQIAPPVYRYVRRHEIVLAEGVPEDFRRDLVATQFLRGGKRLADCWGSLSIWTKFRIAWTLRQFIHQLRGISSVYSDRTGPIGGTSPIVPRGAMFPRDFPATATSIDLVNHFNNVIRSSVATGTYRGVPELRSPSPLVLTHADLHMGNILLDSEGKVWITDWGHSGHYPIWFEYIIAVQMADHQEAPDSWKLLLPLIAEPYFAYQSWAEHMRIIPRVDTGFDVVWSYIMRRISRFRERTLSSVGLYVTI